MSSLQLQPAAQRWAPRGRQTYREELRLKSGQQEPKSPEPMKAAFIASPIPDDAAEKMSNEQWLSGISRHEAIEDYLNKDGVWYYSRTKILS